MDNHVHLILVPATEDGLRGTLAEAHRRYTRRINFREGWRGHLFQGRFGSYSMDDAHLMAAEIPGTVYSFARNTARHPTCARLEGREPPVDPLLRLGNPGRCGQSAGGPHGRLGRPPLGCPLASNRRHQMCAADGIADNAAVKQMAAPTCPRTGDGQQ